MPRLPYDTCIHELVWRQLDHAPDRVALQLGDRQLTRAQLACRSNALARWLRELGVGPERIVGVCVESSFEMIVAVLAVLEAGGAYLPLHPDHPPSRLAHIMRSSGLALVLTQAHIQARLSGDPVFDGHAPTWLSLDDPAAAPGDRAFRPLTRAEVGIGPRNLAYVIYTSGSTGQPKGVLLEHRGLVNLAYAQRHLFEIDHESRVLQFASLTFDAATWEWTMALCWGARLCLLPPGVARSTELGAWIADYRVTHATLPPAVLPQLDPRRVPALEQLILAGETCPASLVSSWAKGRKLWNAYGPTEATVCATVGRYDASTPGFPIGRAIANVGVHVLDDQLRPLAPGEVGEICITGAGVARGYLGDIGRGSEAFVGDPFDPDPDARLYRSGDRGTWRVDGQLEFLGRADRQIKLRGVRIELEEVEFVLSSHPAIAHAAVAVSDDRRLLAYVVPVPSGPPIDATALREHASARLPEQMVPASYLAVEHLPLTHNGKVDHRRLARLDGRRLDERSDAPPRTETEAVIAAVFAELLGVESVGVDGDFFALGGTSLLAVKLGEQLSRHFGLRVPSTLVYQAGTVEALADALDLVCAVCEDGDAQRGARR